MDGRTGDWMEGWIVERTDGRMDGWMDRLMDAINLR